MTSPWENDAVSLLDVFGMAIALHRGSGSSSRAYKDSALNAFSHVDEELSLHRAKGADLTLPLGGINCSEELHNVEDGLILVLHWFSLTVFQSLMA